MADSNKKYITYTDAATFVSNYYNRPLLIYNGSAYSYYYPLTGKNINVINVDGTSAVKSFVAQGSNPTYLNITFKNYIVNKKTTGNAWYPMAIAGKQYANMTNGECLPTYYCSGVTINPYQGKIKVNDLILVTTGGTEISVADLIAPSTATCIMNPITIEIDFEGEYFTFNDFNIYISTPYDYVCYTIGSYGGDDFVGTITPSKNTLTIDSNYTRCNFHFEGNIHGSELDNYIATVQWLINGEFEVSTMDSEVGIGPLTDAVLPNHSFPYSNVYIGIHWA